MRFELESSSGLLSAKLPPRMTRRPPLPSKTVDVHSQTLPARSWMPCGLSPFGLAPATHVDDLPAPPQQAWPAGASSPHG